MNNESKETKVKDKDKGKVLRVPNKNKLFKLYDFNVYDGIPIDTKKEDFNKYKDNKKFIIQMFGINNITGRTASILVDGFSPFFYIKVSNDWTEQRKSEFVSHLRKKMGNYYEDSIVNTELIKKHKLYGFDNKKLHTFIKISFSNNAAFNKGKKMFYNDSYTNGQFNRELIKDGYLYQDEIGITNCYLYEANIPPLLKLFHIKEISPSGWVALPNSKTTSINNKRTHCYYELKIHFNDIIPMKKMEAIAKYSICSFDIEASSSHGDFPVPIKDYKKLATDILENYNNFSIEEKEAYNLETLNNEILTAFGYYNLSYINTVYPKIKSTSIKNLENIFANFIKYIPADNKSKSSEEVLEESDSDSEDDTITDSEKTLVEDSAANFYKKVKKVKAYTKKNQTIFDLIKDDKCEHATKILELNIALTKFYPQLEGDIVTFIGLSFINYGDNKPNRRVIIVKGGCKIPDKYLNWSIENNVTVLERSTEKEVLLTFTKIIKNDNPHIITGYNITGFDFDFMYKRSKEIGCTTEFLKLSRNKDEVCLNKDWRTGEEDLETSKIRLASGEYNLKFIKMPGRIIIDLYNIFRREYTLSSNKLDFTSSYFISDSIKNIDLDLATNTTRIYSKNLTGISVGSYIKFEEIGYSTNNYKKGKKFEIIDINLTESWFTIDSYEELNLETQKMNWGLAKDDVSPQEIFALANGDDYDRWTVGKYCLGDCDNVIWLLLKIDVLTGLIEMSNLCDVPLSFLLLRGQGIKLQSFVSKKCGEKNTLMPVVEKKLDDGGYEGAHVFTPKTGLYLEDPVACVDYSSLYPSSMISENISHDSKVWSKEYDLSDNLIICEGEQDEDGNFIYDNLESEGYKYVDIKYDTYKYIRKTVKAAATKVIVGYKICRFAQFNDGKAIMPSILEELLTSRKATRKQIPLQTDDFMKNVLDKRQLSIKVTANSLYGQCGAQTSAFYEKDIAASTTATGRKLLFYGRAIIEECYNDIEIKMSDNKIVKTKAECIYGDTDSVFFKFNLKDPITNEKIINKQALIYTIELAKQAGKLASKFLKGPHDLEYEKTFWPWALLSKKRYVGMLYEDDPDKGKMKFMGIVLKRRDNAPIVKDIYGGVVNILMKDKSIAKAIKFVHECLQSLIKEEYSIEKLLVTKALRGYYKNPKQIAHKVLAERIGIRDAGNKPGSGDRMYYAYIKNPNKKALQGEKIETPNFIQENNLKLDYGHYISNQIMKPLLQLFALELENIPDFKERQFYLKTYNDKKNLTWEQEIDKLKEKWTEPEKYVKKYEELRCKEVRLTIFDNYLKELK